MNHDDLKITVPLLRALGCEELADESTPAGTAFLLRSHGVRYAIVQRDDGECWSFGDREDKDGKLKPYTGHLVTHLSELIGLAYLDGELDGKNTLRRDLRELLEEEGI